MDDSKQYQPPVESGATDRSDELERLRERLAFYESFDQLIQDNVSRAGNLLREAAARHQDSELALRNSTAQFEEQQLAERIEYRKIFSGLLDDITTVQQNVERLARQVADALDDLEAVIPAAGEAAALESDTLPSIPTFRPSTAGEIGAGLNEPAIEQPEVAASEANGEPLEAPAPASEPELDTIEREAHEQHDGVEVAELESDPAGQDEVVHQGYTDHAPNERAEPVDELLPEDDSGGEHEQLLAQRAGQQGSSTFSDIVQASVERISQAIGGRESPEASDVPDEPPIEPEGISVDLAPTAYEADDELEEGEGWTDSGEPAATTLLVHGVPRATTALSLKRYLEGLDQVHSVEPREYAEGVLRLQVSSERPVRLDDLQGWPEASALELVADRDDFVEVRLSQ